MNRKIFGVLLSVAVGVGVATTGCGDDDDDNNGAAGSGGGAGSSGGGGSSGSAGGDGTGTGPGASLKCKSSDKNAYETYGPAFGKVDASIIGNVAAELQGGNPGFGPSFNEVAKDPARVQKLSDNLAAFLIFAYGGPNNYKGRTMDETHKGMAITKEQYDYFIANVVVKALKDNGVPDDDISSCFAPVVTDAAFVGSIVGK